MAAPKEIAAGLFHWTAVHPEIKVPVSSYYLPSEGILIDPLLPSRNGLAWLRKHGPPKHILLTNRLHSRHSAKLVEAFACAVWCNRAGLSHLATALHARPFDPGDELPGHVRAIGIDAICPDESALLLAPVRAACVADGVVRRGDGPLSFVPDEIMVDDPRDAERVKRELKAAYLRLAEEPFDHLLLAHGNPLLDTGREALRAWASQA